MKKSYFLLLLAPVIFAACKKNSDVITTPPVAKTDTLSNIITGDMTLDANVNYVINGQVFGKKQCHINNTRGRYRSGCCKR